MTQHPSLAPHGMKPDNRESGPDLATEIAALRAEVARLRTLAEEAANTLEAIAECTWDKRHPEEFRRGCQHASELAGVYEEIRKSIAGEPT